MFQSVSEDRAVAAVWADAENTADPDLLQPTRQ